MEPERERLNAAMNESRLDLRLRWTEVARRAGVDSSTLRRIRYGEGAVSDLTARGLEDALEWPHGTVADILAGGLSTEQPEPDVEPIEPIDPVRERLLREEFAELSRKYGKKGALKLIDEVVAEFRDTEPQHRRSDERGRDAG